MSMRGNMKSESQKYSRVILRGGFGFRKYDVREEEAPDRTHVDDCKQWLMKHAKKKHLPKGLNSYYLKHVVEEAIGHYVTNGAFIQAAIELGFKYSSIEGPNAFFHIELKLPEDEWMRVKPEGFSKWFFKQDELFLAQDAKADPNWPRRAKRFMDFWRYLNRSCGINEEDKDTLSEAWETWSGRTAPRPDSIDTDAVYDRECDFIKYGDPYPVAPSGYTYLYALVDNEDKFDRVRVRYVGQTTSPHKRLRDHVHRPGSIERVKWIGALLNDNKTLQMAVFSTVSLPLAKTLEKAAIYAFCECETRWDEQSNGFPPWDDALLNIDM